MPFCLREAIIKQISSVGLSVRVYQGDSQRAGFRENSYLKFLINLSSHSDTVYSETAVAVRADTRTAVTLMLQVTATYVS